MCLSVLLRKIANYLDRQPGVPGTTWAQFEEICKRRAVAAGTPGESQGEWAS